MASKINVYGPASLKEVYENEKHKKYSAILSLTVEAERGAKVVSPKLNFEVPITQDTYKQLKDALSKSKDTCPMLMVEGNLEFILDSKCLN